MRIFVELPTWLGDAVMASAAVDALWREFGGECDGERGEKVSFVFFGSFVATELYKTHPACEKVVVDESRKGGFRFLNLVRTARALGKFDMAFSFRGSFASSFFLAFLRAKKKSQFEKKRYKAGLHQVLRYLNFVSGGEPKSERGEVRQRLFFDKFKFARKSLGLAPGAAFGSAKRWRVEGFVEVARELSTEFDVVLFGGKEEREICEDIANKLAKSGVACENLAGKTSVGELCQKVAGLSLFVSNDSGPMHIAAAFGVPTVAVFGPTKCDETSPFGNEKAVVVRASGVACAPCMKRVCPTNHECMEAVSAKMVLEACVRILEV